MWGGEGGENERADAMGLVEGTGEGEDAKRRCRAKDAAARADGTAGGEESHAKTGSRRATSWTSTSIPTPSCPGSSEDRTCSQERSVHTQ